MKPATRIRRAHCIGIAGSGMRSLVAVLRAQGWHISGSDARLPAPDKLPRELAGLELCSGHAAANLPPAVELVIYSDAVDPGNSERIAAVARGIDTVSYPQMLARLMSAGVGWAVAGTHGKSSTTAMTAEIMLAAGLSPTYIYGAQPIIGTGGRAGSGTGVLVEACEYRENFLYFRPRGAVLLNIEPDHFDYFTHAQAVEEAFTRFASQVHPSGSLIVSAMCPTAMRAARGATAAVETFGVETAADWQGMNLFESHGCYSFDLLHKGQELGRVRLAVPGRHNVANAVAAAALSAAAGAENSTLAPGLARFRGLRRRLELAGRIEGIPWIDDFAHHPTEITAALETVRQMFPGRRIFTVFQPHQASRTQALLDEFARSLQNTETLLVTEIFRARETAELLDTVGPADLAARIRARGGNVLPLHALDQISEYLAEQIEGRALGPADVLVTLGAGNVGSIGHGLVQRFRECLAAG